MARPTSFLFTIHMYALPQEHKDAGNKLPSCYSPRCRQISFQTLGLPGRHGRAPDGVSLPHLRFQGFQTMTKLLGLLQGTCSDHEKPGILKLLFSNKYTRPEKFVGLFLYSQASQGPRL